MMKNFRDFGNTWVSKALLLVLIVAFGAWGVESYLHNQTGNNAMTVNGDAVPLRLVEQRFNNLKSQIEASNGKPLTPEAANAMNLPELVIGQTIQQVLVEQQAKTLQLEPAVRVLQAVIRKEAAFLDDQGNFSTAQYRSVLQRAGLTVGTFEDTLKREEQTRLLAQLLQGLPSPTLVALAPLTALSHGATTVRLLTLAPGAVPVPKLTEAELETYYKNNQDRFTLPETRSFLVVNLNPTVLAGTVRIPEAQVMAEYTNNSATYVLPERRTVRHILLSSEASATALLPQLTNEVAFAKAADAFSQDPGNLGTKGGSLGSIAATDVVPAFAEVAFSLPVGRVSSPTQTQFGWHVMWVSGISPSALPPLAEVQPAIEASLKDAAAQDVMEQAATQLDDQLAAGKPLAELAKKLGLAVLSFSNIKATDETMPTAIREAAFGAPEGEAAPAVNLPDGTVAFVQVQGISPSVVQPLVAVRAQVEKEATLAATQTALQTTATALLAQLRGPEGGKVSIPSSFSSRTQTLQHATTDEAEQQLLMRVAAQATGSWLPAPVQQGDVWQLVQVQSRAVGAPSVAEATVTVHDYATSLSRNLEALLINQWFGEAKIVLNQPRLQQLFGRPVQWQDPQR
jgi:peptidyl-prolyl cis-trans isomerase D